MSWLILLSIQLHSSPLFLRFLREMRNRPDCYETPVVQDRLKALVEGLYHSGISVELGRVVPETADWQNYH